MTEQEKKYKHYNAAHVIGRIEGVPTTKRDKEGKGAPYLRLKINCAHPQRGNVIIYGQMRNKLKFESLLKHMKEHPATPYRFKAFYNQYDKQRGDEASQRLSSFSFWDWYPDPEEGKDPRAVFILVGEISGIENNKLSLELHREGNNEELFDLYALQSHLLNGLTAGETAEVVGEMMSKDGEDRFGRTSSLPILPYIAEINPRKEKGEGGTPF